MAQVKGRQIPVDEETANPGTLVGKQMDELLVNVLPELLSGGDALGDERRIGVRHYEARSVSFFTIHTVF